MSDSEEQDFEDARQKPFWVEIQTLKHLRLLLPGLDTATLRSWITDLAFGHGYDDTNRFLRRRPHPLYGAILSDIWKLPDTAYVDFPSTDDEEESEGGSEAEVSGEASEEEQDESTDEDKAHTEIKREAKEEVKEEDQELDSTLHRMEKTLDAIIKRASEEPLSAFEHVFYVFMNAQEDLLESEEEAYRKLVYKTLASLSNLLTSDVIEEKYDPYADDYPDAVEQARKKIFYLFSNTQPFSNAKDKDDVGFFGTTFTQHPLDLARKAEEEAQAEEAKRLREVQAREEEERQAIAREKEEKKAERAREIQEARELENMPQEIEKLRKRYKALVRNDRQKFGQYTNAETSVKEAAFQELCSNAGWTWRITMDRRVNQPQLNIRRFLMVYVNDKAVSQTITPKMTYARDEACQDLMDTLNEASTDQIARRKRVERQNYVPLPKKPGRRLLKALRKTWYCPYPRKADTFRLETEDAEEELDWSRRRPLYIPIDAQEHLQMIFPWMDRAALESLVEALVLSNKGIRMDHLNHYLHRRPHPVFGSILADIWDFPDSAYSKFPPTDDGRSSQKVTERSDSDGSDGDGSDSDGIRILKPKVKKEEQVDDIKPELDVKPELDDEPDIKVKLETATQDSDSILSKLKQSLAEILERANEEPLSAFEHMYHVLLTAQDNLPEEDYALYRQQAYQTLTSLQFLLTADTVNARYPTERFGRNGQTYNQAQDNIHHRVFYLLSATKPFSDAADRDDFSMFGQTFVEYNIEQAAQAEEDARLEEEARQEAERAATKRKLDESERPSNKRARRGRRRR